MIQRKFRGDLARWWAALTAVAALCAARALAAEAPTDNLRLDAPPFPALKQAYDQQKASMSAPRVAKLKALLTRRQADAEQALKEKTMAQNIKGVAVAKAALVIFADALTNLDQHGDFQFPDKVRKDLDATLEACRAEKQAIDAEYNKVIEPLKEGLFVQFCEAAQAQGGSGPTPDKAKLKTRFLSWIEPAKVEPSAPSLNRTNAPPGTTAGSTNATENGATPTNAAPQASKQPVVPDIIGQSGPGERWVTFGRWTGEMAGMDVISIPVIGRSNDTQWTQAAPMSGRDSVLQYKVIRVLPERTNYLFRVKTIPEREPVSVLEWPRRANDYTLLVRTTPSTQMPAPHGFDLQVSLPPEQLDALFPPEREAGSNTVGQFTLKVVTTPPGAQVFVDGILCQAADGGVVTPCEILLAAGAHSIRLRARGFQDVVSAHYGMSSNRVLEWTFYNAAHVTKKNVAVSAMKRWTAAEVKVNKGDVIAVEATGQWACARKGERCTADGYPINQEFYEYYLSPQNSPREVRDANYGALIMKIGEDGTPVVVGSHGTLTAAEAGPLFFDINEADDGKSRHDNSGAIMVKLTVTTPAPKFGTE